MASRAESRIQPVPFLTVGGVNQRVYPTELSPAEYGNVVGVFPEFAGLQSRIFGKRLLQKYTDGVYSIYQFWTPMGYGVGLYQFTGTMDYGTWLTPNSSINLDPLPLGIDGGGMSLDEFGNGYGSNFGYGDVNTCTLSFLNGSSDHSSCNPPASPVDDPNDTNGGPAGQGRKCSYTHGTNMDIAIPSPNGTMYGTWSTQQLIPSGPTPPPLIPTIPTQRPTSYTAGGGPLGNVWLASGEQGSQKVNLGFGSWIDDQTADSQNTTGTLDLTPYVDPSNPPGLIEIQVQHNSVAPFDQFWIPLQTGLITDYSAVAIDVWDYLDTRYSTKPSSLNGLVIGDFILFTRIRFTYGGRHCK